MDSMKFVEAVASTVSAGLTQHDLPVITAAEKSGIPRTTLMRRLGSPEISPFNLIELSQLSELLGIRVSDLITQAEALASKEGEKR